MASYSPEQLTLQDGKLVAKNPDGSVVPVSPHDKLVTTTYDYTANTNPSKRNIGSSPYTKKETPIWQIQDLSKVRSFKPTKVTSGGGDSEYTSIHYVPENPLAGFSGNPLALDSRTALLTGEDRSALYGGGYSGDIRKYGSEKPGEFRKRDDIRTRVGDYNAAFVQSALKQMYPNATQEQLDDAAYRAMTEDDPNAPRIRYRADEMRDRTADVLKSGYGDGRYMPTDIVRRIGYFMGGLPEQGAAAIDAWEQQNKGNLIKMQDAVYKYDKSQGNTFKNVAADLGPLLSIGAGFMLPGLGTALGGGMLGAAGAGAITGGGLAALTGGDVLKGALLGGAGGALGQYASGLEGGANFTGPPSSASVFSPSQLTNVAGKAGLGVLSGQSLADATLNASTSLAGSAGTGYLNQMGLDPRLSSGLVNAGLTELRGGNGTDALLKAGLGYGLSQAKNAFQSDNSFQGNNTVAPPANQVATLGGNMGSEFDSSKYGGYSPDMSLWTLGDSDQSLSDLSGFKTGIDSWDDLLPSGSTGSDFLDAIIQADGNYIDPFSKGSMTGVPGLNNLSLDDLAQIGRETGLDLSDVIDASNTSDWATPEPSLWEKANSLIGKIKTEANTPAGKMLTGALAQYLKNEGDKRNREAYQSAQTAAQTRSPYFHASLNPVATAIGARGTGFTIPTQRDPASFIAPSTRGRG